MSTDFFGSPVEISGRTPAYAPVMLAGRQLRAEEIVQRAEDVLDVIERRRHVREIAVVVRRQSCRPACDPSTAA